MFDPIALAGNIKTYRLAKRLSQSELAARLSVSTQSVSKWECGVSTPDIANLVQVAEILGVSPDVLLNCNTRRQKVMIGVDGGGSKTEMIVFDENGRLLDRKVLGACNPNAIGVRECGELLVGGIGKLCPDQADLMGIYVGSAGFLLGDNAREVRAAIKKSFPQARVKCDTDILNVIASCTEEARCIAAICGTGSTVCAKEGERLTRLTGWGYLLSKSGSGFDIGRDALYRALQHREGLGEETRITELIEGRLGCSVIDNIREIYSRDQSYIASFAPLVMDAYRAGDTVAEEILRENAERVAESRRPSGLRKTKVGSEAKRS